MWLMTQQSRLALVTSWKQEWHCCCSQPCSLPYWLFQLYLLLPLGNHQLWVQPPFPQQLTSELPHCPPLSGCPCPVETQHPVDEMMKSYFLFLSTEEKWIISSSWFPFTIQHHSRAKWVCLYSSITWWTMKNLHSYTAGLEEINQKRLKKGHSDWPLVTNFDFIHHFTTRRP